MPTIQCPICDRVDQAQRVTAIVEGETHDTTGGSETIGGSYIEGDTDHYMGRGFDRERVGDSRFSASSASYSSTRINVRQQSRLAKRLTPPPPPTKPSELKYELSPGQTTVVAVLAAIPSAFFWWWLIGLDWSIDGFGSVLLCGATLGVAAVVWGGLTALLNALILRDAYPAQERMLMEKEHQAQVAQYDYEKHTWDRAMNRWNSMFYCRRCDVVYVPGDTFAPMSPDDMIALAYAEA